MIKRILCLILTVSLLSTPIMVLGAEDNGTAVSIQEKVPLASPVVESMYSEKADLKYLLTFPKGYDANSSEKRPLIVFLHGSGERGNDIEGVKKHGIPKVYNQIEDFPFITISPQCPADSYWDILTESLNILIDETIQNYNIDVDRVYLTGLSMGGYGSWEMAMCHPEKFAAVAPICGGGDPFEIENMKYIPVWAFHGQKDPTVPIAEEQRMVDALKKYTDNVKFTIYPDGVHDVWTETYNNPELYKWLLQQKRTNQMASVSVPKFQPDIISLSPTKVAYVREFGENCEMKAINEIKEFANSNNISNAKYFGFSVSEDISGSKKGYEAWVTLNKDVHETDVVKVKETDGGQFATYSAGNNTDNIERTWKKLYARLRPSEYKNGPNDDLEEIVFSENNNDVSKYVMYLSIVSRNDAEHIVIGCNGADYSENGSWRQYGSIRTSAALGSPNDSAQWTPDIQTPGLYKVSIYKPTHPKSDPKAKIDIAFDGGTDTQYLDYTQGIPEWAELGIYPFTKGKNGSIKVSSSSKDSFVRAAYVKLELVKDKKELSDIKGHWAEQSIQELACKGIINGNEDGTFQPQESVSIEAFIKMVITVLGYKLENGQDSWSSTFIVKAKELSIVQEGEFSDYTLPITRLQMAQILTRAINDRDHDDSLEEYISYIADFDSIPIDALDSVLRCYKNGILTGNEDNTFRPENNMTRAEGAAVIQRMINPGKRKPIELPATKEPDTTENADDSITLPACKANIDNTNVIRVKDNGNIGYWSADESASWELDVKKAGTYTIEITYALPDSFVGSEVIAEINGQTVKTIVEQGTGSWDTLKTMQLGTVNLQEGKTTLIMKHGKIVSGTFIDLNQIKLIPVNSD